MEKFKSVGPLLIVFSLISFVYSTLTSWESGYVLGFLFLIVGITLTAFGIYKAKPSYTPDEAGAEFQSVVKKTLGFELKTTPIIIVLLFVAYLALSVFQSLPLFYVVVIVIFGLLYYSRWLSLKVAYQGAQYVAKQDTVTRTKYILFVVASVFIGLTFWYFVGRISVQSPTISDSTQNATSQQQLENVLSETATTSSTDISTNSLKTYRNDKYGFEFQYPPLDNNQKIKIVETVMDDNSISISLVTDDFGFDKGIFSFTIFNKTQWEDFQKNPYVKSGQYSPKKIYINENEAFIFLYRDNTVEITQTLLKTFSVFPPAKNVLRKPVNSTKGRLTIPELDVSIPFNNDTGGLGIVYVLVNSETIFLSSEALVSKANGLCRPEDEALGALVVSKTKVDDGPGPSIPLGDGRYFYYAHPQDVCSPDEALSPYIKFGISTYREAFKDLKPATVPTP